MNRPNERALAFCNSFAYASGIFAIIVGASVIAGWCSHIQFLKTFALSDATMEPTTAAAFILMGVAFWLLTRKPERTASHGQVLLAGVCATIVTLLGGLKIAEYFLGADLGVHQPLFRLAREGAVTPYSSRLSLVAAVNCLFLGGSLLLLFWSDCRFIRLAHILALLIGFSALIAFAAHFFLSEVVRQSLAFFDIAPHTSLTFMVMACGIFCVRPRDAGMALFTAESAGGSVLRRLLLPVTLLPVMLNWLEFRFERQGLFPVGFLWVFDAALTVFLLGLLVWEISLNLHRKDQARETAEAELRSSEERYRRLVEMSPDGILVETGSRIEFANGAITQLLGAQQLNDVVGKSLFAFIHPDSRAKFELELRRVTETGIALPLTPLEIMRLDGASVDVEVAASVVDFQRRRVAQVVVRDVSERKRAEETLRQSIERFQLVDRATNDAVWDWDITKDVSWWNDRFFEQFGYDRDTPPNVEAWVARIHPDDRVRITSTFSRALESSDAVWADEYRLQFADGSYGHIHDRGYILRDPAGKPMRMLGAMMDITKRKQAEEARHQSEERFRLIAETINEVFWMADVKIERIVYVSPAYERIWGRSCESLYSNPRSFLDAIHVEDRERVLADLELENSGQPFDHEYRIIRPDETVRWIWDRGFPVRGDADVIGHYVGVAQDITERKVAEETLRRDASILAQLHDAVVCTDLDGRVTYWNAAATRLLGWTPEETLGKSFLDHQPAEEHAERWRRFELVRQGQELRGERRSTRKDGTRLWIMSHIARYHDEFGQPVGVVSASRDITERIKSDTIMREQKELLQTIVDNIPVMIVFMSAQGRTEWGNHEWVRVLGWSLEEVQSRSILPEMYPDRLSRREVLDFALNPQPGWKDFRAHTKDGRVIETMWASVLLSDGRSIGIGQDITERVQMDRAMRITASRLRVLSQRLLEAQESERREIARELHDEIGQSLTGVEMTLQALMESVSSDAKRARLKESLDLVTSVLDQVRDLSLDLRPSMLDDLGLVPTLQWYAEQQHKRTALNIELRVQYELPRFNPTLETACYRIVQEALTNVVRHAHARSVSIEIQKNGDQLTLRVRDDGHGFDVAAIRQQAQRGASFGLLGMQERATLLGGSMEIKSEQGKGAEINAWLPIEPPATNRGTQ